MKYIGRSTSGSARFVERDVEDTEMCKGSLVDLTIMDSQNGVVKIQINTGYLK
jgi:hypothetical protein